MSFEYPDFRRDESMYENFHGESVADPYRWLEDPYSDETKAFIKTQNEMTDDYINECQFKQKIIDSLTNAWSCLGKGVSPVADPYRWLEDPYSEETKTFIKTQNEMTDDYINKCSLKQKVFDSLSNVWDYPKESVPYRYGDRVFQLKNSGLQNQFVFYSSTAIGDEQIEFLDPNKLSDDGTVSLSGWSFSEDGKLFAYGLSTGGSDWIRIKFKDAVTREDLDDTLENVKFSPLTWVHDNSGFLYAAYKSKDEGKPLDGSETDTVENQKLYYHKIKTPQSEDILLVEFDDPQLRIHAEMSNCGKYVIVSPRKGCKNNLVYVASLTYMPITDQYTVTGKLHLEEIVGELNADYEFVGNDSRKFVFRTNKDAPNYKLVVIDLDSPEECNWVDLIEEHPKDVMDFCMPINNTNLVVRYLKDVKNVLQIRDFMTGALIYDFNLEVGSVTEFSGRRRDMEMYFNFCSFLIPNKTYKVQFGPSGMPLVSVTHETVITNHDPSLYETKQVFYRSKDSTEIPMFIVHKKDFPMDGSKPCQLYGYGGFNISVTPGFSVSRLLFIQHFDAAFAVANIRGGGEYGDNWHNGARFEKKQNCFDDFQYAAKYLISNNYTNNKKLVINGASNGGLLVAACINQEPNLFGAAICQVGVLDMLRYHKFTIGYAWKSDYGCSEEPNEFNYLYKYSPLHNIKVPPTGQYPATLLLTADHDDRVVPLHSFKFIAQLQHVVGKCPTQENPLLIRIETKAGHGAGKPTAKLIEEITDIFCFIARSLKIDLKF